jgi:PadR family transcriptional regulator AphA
MDAKTLCLGLLSFGNASGYDLKKHVESAGDHFFASGFGSIYPALSSLMKQGLIEPIGKSIRGRQDRKVYRITATGRSELIRMLSVIEPRHLLRSDLFALLYFAHLVTPERITQVIDDRLTAMGAANAATIDPATPLKHPNPTNAQFVAGLKTALFDTTIKYFRENRGLLVP